MLKWHTLKVNGECRVVLVKFVINYNREFAMLHGLCTLGTEFRLLLYVVAGLHLRVDFVDGNFACKSNMLHCIVYSQ